MSPLYESEVRTMMLGSLDNYKVNVFFSDELIKTHPYELAYSPVHGGYLPYLFTGYFYDEKFQRWFFSNARMHEEMKEAVTSHLGREMKDAYGQLLFNQRLVQQGKLKIERLILHEPVPQGAIAQLRREVRLDYFDPSFRVIQAKY